MNKIKWYLLTIGICFMSYGIYRNEADIVFKKAIKICLECIGVG
ncbi:CD1871A family CXXC motif-containing protein [Acidaminobacter sp. JC074]|nr:CD1871A family CXXC motif-containing protein [Acidaminobacter sp. JC074]